MTVRERVSGRVMAPRAVTLSAETSTDERVRVLRIGAVTQVAAAVCVAALIGWTGYVTIDRAVGVERPLAGPAGAVLRSAYENRIAELEAARLAMEAERDALADRLSVAADTIAAYQDTVEAHELARADLDATGRLQAAQLTAQRSVIEALRDEVAAAERASDTARAELAAVSAARDDLSDTLAMLSGTLTGSAEAAEGLATERSILEQRVAELEADVVLAAQRKDRLMTRLETAVSSNLALYEEMFARAGADIGDILAASGGETDPIYVGSGGPEVAVPASLGGDAALPVAPTEQERLEALLGAFARLNRLTEASDHVPFATPVVDGHRLTSGFGPRRDPFNGRTRMHEGLDFAAPIGTPILAPAEGEVTFAGWQSGYGKVVKIRHDFGFETLYAHLNRIRVEVGESVSRGDRIGDMGSTGRSTGSHLHYEIHLDGQAVDPANYLKAARNVL